MFEKHNAKPFFFFNQTLLGLQLFNFSVPIADITALIWPITYNCRFSCVCV